MVGLSCNKQCIQAFSGGREFLCLSVGWLSQQGIFLSVACHFVLVSLPEVRCQRWGENVSFLPGICCYLPQSDLCRLVGSILQLLWSSKPALGYECPAAFASILSMSGILSLWTGCAWGALRFPLFHVRPEEGLKESQVLFWQSKELRTVSLQSSFPCSYSCTGLHKKFCHSRG